MFSVFYIFSVFSAPSAWFCQSRWEPVLQTGGVVLLLATGDTGEGVLVSLVARWQKLNTGGWEVGQTHFLTIWIGYAVKFCAPGVWSWSVFA
jgi:hypothetical protein